MILWGFLEEKNKNQKLKHRCGRVEKPPFEINYYNTNDGRLAIEFIDNELRGKKFYDVTRIVINNPVDFEFSHPQDQRTKKVCRVQDLLVSWYDRNDAAVFGRTTRADIYTEVLAEIDIESLTRDPMYMQYVMRQLLDQKRVEGYLQKGLEDNPDRPCGIYVGGVRNGNTQGKMYDKFFNLEIGKRVHNTPYMQKKRQKHKEELISEIDRKMEKNNKEKERLQKEKEDVYQK